MRNQSDGSVECLAQGPRETVEELVGVLRRGPTSAEVEDVEVDWQDVGDDLEAEFQIRGWG